MQWICTNWFWQLHNVNNDEQHQEQLNKCTNFQSYKLKHTVFCFIFSLFEMTN